MLQSSLEKYTMVLLPPAVNPFILTKGPAAPSAFSTKKHQRYVASFSDGVCHHRIAV